MTQGSEQTGALMGIVPTLPQILAPIGAMLWGWKVLTPRNQRWNMVQREAGRTEVGLRLLYRLPHILNRAVLVVLFVMVLLAFYGAFYRGNATSPPVEFLSLINPLSLFMYEHVWWVVLAAGTAGVVIQIDLFARIFVHGARLLSWLPIPILRGWFGPDGDSIGWHQASEFLRNQDKAQLFWIDSHGVERVATTIFERMATEEGVLRDYASTPAQESISEKANIALFGCIMEQIETDLKMPSRRWDIFYDALAKASEEENLFKQQNILVHDREKSFGQDLRETVNPLLEARNQPQIGLYVDKDVDRAFKILRTKFKGDASNLARGITGFFLGSVQTLFRRAAKFPRLNDDGMRPQFVKLCIRWGVLLDANPRIFVQPFSANIAWLLLHFGALNVLSDIELVTFKGPIDRPASRIVAKAVIDEFVRQVETARSDEGRKIRDRYPNLDEPMRDWLLRQEADTTMWRVARELANEGVKRNWEGDDWQWKLDRRQAFRV